MRGCGLIGSLSSAGAAQRVADADEELVVFAAPRVDESDADLDRAVRLPGYTERAGLVAVETEQCAGLADQTKMTAQRQRGAQVGAQGVARTGYVAPTRPFQARVEFENRMPFTHEIMAKHTAGGTLLD